MCILLPVLIRHTCPVGWTWLIWCVGVAPSYAMSRKMALLLPYSTSDSLSVEKKEKSPVVKPLLPQLIRPHVLKTPHHLLSTPSQPSPLTFTYVPMYAPS